MKNLCRHDKAQRICLRYWLLQMITKKEKTNKPLLEYSVCVTEW